VGNPGKGTVLIFIGFSLLGITLRLVFDKISIFKPIFFKNFLFDFE